MISASSCRAVAPAIEPLEARIAPAAAVFDLASLNGANGFKVQGVAAGDLSGTSVSGAGDINGDGIDDLLIGAQGADPNGNYSGATYVVFGKAGGFTMPFNLATVFGSNGFKIQGEAADDASGRSVSAAGDVNRDGFDDLIIGAPMASPNAKDSSGASYVVYGKGTAFTTPLNLSTLVGTNGFKITGETAFDLSGGSVSDAGDINGDGIDDLLIGARGADPNGESSGATYVVFGNAAGFTTPLSLSTLNGTTGFKIQGEVADNYAGISVSAAGDFNGDGFDDLVIGAYHASPGGKQSAGATYVIYGKAGGFSTPLNLSSLTAATGLVIGGEAAFDRSGSSVSGAGDVNGDGFDDLIIGAMTANQDPSGFFASGASYVVFGKAGLNASLDLAKLSASNGFKIYDSTQAGYVGSSVSGAGDFNGDGFDDLIIGAFQASSFVVFGKKGGFGKLLDLSTLDGSNGFKVPPVAGEGPSGKAVSGVGDFNADGFDDVVIGAPIASPNGIGSGASYVIFGGVNIAVGGRSATYVDAEGDLVTVAVSKGELKPEDFTFAASGIGSRLRILDLRTPIGVDRFGGANVTISATPGLQGGDGFAAIGYLNATGLDLGAVKVDGDLLRIDAGDAETLNTPAVKSLAVQSLGRVGSTAEAIAGFLTSNLHGKLGSLTVKTDIVTARLILDGGADGQIGSITVGGSLIGPKLPIGATTGGINTSGNIGSVKVGIDLVGGVDSGSGTISSGGTIGVVTVGGSLLGGSGTISGSLQATGGFGAVKILGDVRGGTASDAGAIITGGPVKSIFIGGDLVGGTAQYAGSITTHIGGEDAAPIGSVTIKHSLIGGTHALTGILAGATLGAVKIGGDVRGISAAVTAKIVAEGLLTPTTLKAALAIGSVTVGGTVRFGEILAGYTVSGGTAAVASNADVQIGAVTVTGDWEASTIAAGALANGNGYGNVNDTIFSAGELPFASRIAAIVIKGALYGTLAAGDHFGFVAQEIGSLQIGKGTPAIINGNVLAPATNDFRVRLV